MKRLLCKVAVGISIGWSITGCAQPPASSFEAGAPDGSAIVVEDAALGGGAEGSIVFLPPVLNQDASLVISLTGDGGVVGGGEAGAPVALKFVPSTATVTIDGTGTQTQAFSLQANYGNGFSNVTAQAVEFDRPDLASVTATEPVMATAPSAASATPYGGTGTVHAIYNGLEATATLTVQVKLSLYGAGLSAVSPSVVALNGGSLAQDPAPAISPILYPYDATVWPLGLTSPLVMWNAGSAGDVYRLHYAENAYAVDYYTVFAPAPAPPGQARLDQTTWDRLTNSNGSLYGSKDPITFTLSRWDSASQMAYTSATETWTVAPESLRGAIYYWSASQSAAGRVGHISRFQPGVGAVPQVLNNGTCMGCHAVNAQGTMLVADIDDQDNGAMYPSVAPYGNWSNTRAWSSFDITQATAPSIYTSNKFGADVALTPDAKYLVFGGPTTPPGSKYISLGDPLTSTVVADSGLDDVVLDTGETNLEMPAFSPDGTKLAVVESNSGHDPDNVLPGSPETIAYLSFDEATATFDPTLHLIVQSSSPVFTAGSGLGYPSFTPDSQAVAFHAGTTSTGCTGSCDDTTPDDGNLFLAPLAAGSTPIRLAAANDPPDPADQNSSVEPTFNPVVRGGYSWAVFTSMRKWGNQPFPAAVTATVPVNGKRRLWVAPVDTTIGTADPSHPAIYLEGQEDTPNMRGFWTLAGCIPTASTAAAPDAGAAAADAATSGPPVGTPCTNGFECCSGFCENSMCVEPNQLACVGLGGACMQAGDCCNSPPVQCLDGICAVPVTR
jgi:hypothetical protein